MFKTDSENAALIDDFVNSLTMPEAAPEGAFPLVTPTDPDWEFERAGRRKGDSTDSTDSTEVADAIDKMEIGREGAVLNAAPAILPNQCPDDNPALAEPIEYHLDGRRVIKVEPGKQPEAMRLAETCLANTGRYFQREGSIVEIRVDPATQEITADELSPIALAHALAGVSVWKRLDGRNKMWALIDPADRVCKALVGVGKFEVLAVLKGLARQPYLRPDGSLCQAAGHDLVTGLYGVFNADCFDVPEAPSREQAAQALGTLAELIDEFPFATPNDRSAALAAMVTAAIRPSLAQAPMFHVRAPQIASGKSYLCSLITALATPDKVSPVSFPTRDEECTKLLLALLKSAPAVIVFDNLTDDIKPFKSLNTVLTEERFQDRIMRNTNMLPVGTRTLFLSSGNNVGPIGDMTRRCVTINLDPGCELPAARAFKRADLIGEVRRERNKYVAAALTVVRAWIAADRPRTEAKPLVSFMEWTELCCQPLMWLGLPDPAKSVFDGMASDPDQLLLGQFLQGWNDLFADKAKHVRDVVAHVRSGCPGGQDFEDVLLDVTGGHGQVDTRKLGKWMARHEGRKVGGLRLEQAPMTRNVASWRVESVASIESVAVAPLEKSVTSPA